MQPMTKTRLRPLLLANLLLVGINSHVEAVTIRGARSCGDWVKNSAERGWAKVAQEGWLIGYLSGKAMSTNVDVLKSNEVPSLSLWVDNYCKSNPLDDSNDAGEELFLELKRRARL